MERFQNNIQKWVELDNKSKMKLNLKEDCKILIIIFQKRV